MDTHNEGPMAFLNGGRSEEKMVAGAKQLRKAIISGRAARVYLAQNADPKITEPIASLCESNRVAYSWVPTMTDLGRACKIDVGAAAAAAVRN